MSGLSETTVTVVVSDRVGRTFLDRRSRQHVNFEFSFFFVLLKTKIWKTKI
jgi:hypothetical protein